MLVLNQMMFPSGSTPTYDPEFFFALEVLESIALGMNQLPPVVIRTFSKFLHTSKAMFSSAPRKAQLKIISLIRHGFSRAHR